MPNQSKALHDLFESAWDYRMEQWPTWASSLGDRRWNDRWPDVTPDAFEARHRHNQEMLKRLAGFDRDSLDESDRLNYDLFKREYDSAVEGHRFGWYLAPLNQREGPQTAHELADNLRFDSMRDYKDWIGRLCGFPQFLRQNIALMREGIARGIVLPEIVMSRVPPQIDKQIVADPAESPFFRPFTRFPDSMSDSERSRLSEAATEAISTGVIPAFYEFKTFFEDEYLPASLKEVGIWQLPHGEAMYAYMCREYTTTSLTPEEIHKVGLAEVKRIGAQMRAVKERVGFAGSMQEFFESVRADKRFYYRSGKELLNAYRAMSKRIDPLLVKLFKTLPRTPYGVDPIPMEAAPDTTTAYYGPPAADGSRAGIYWVNLYKPEARPKWEMMALSLHEAVPGHHLQIALAMEQGELPKFRRFGGYTAYIEGWALYAESLGEEMGLYDDPYDKLGQLTYEMWRAVRLVIDTGIHYFRWSREKAIDYFLAHAAKNELDVVNEVDRYIAWPAQALAYKIGELSIKDLRARATRDLGDRFDLRNFHEMILEPGAVPLSILEQHAKAWVEKA